MPNPTVPDFTDVAARKLADLLEKGFVITGYCFERQVDGTQPQRGFVDFAGFVGWWRIGESMREPLSADLIESAAPEYLVDDFLDFNAGVKFAERAHGITDHGVADMKGSQDAENH